ncbi:MAG: FGGY family carbohydrate kinase [Spirochaetes bacterium]|nr:FGGY family carbohydrate kinase [Spirochaetota bacterium]
MAETYLLGIDFGGGGAKATLLRGDGHIAATAVREYPTYHPREGWAEQNPDEVYAAFKILCREILQRSAIAPDAIAAICLDAATHTGVLLDASGGLVRDSIYWTDRRSVEESAHLSETMGAKIMELCLNATSPIWTLPQLIWLRNHEPKVHARIKRILFMKDYIRLRLTGEFVTDRIDAMGSLLMDERGGIWSEELCGFAGLDTSMLPRLADPQDIVGKVRTEAAAETGLAVGTPVLAGAPDTVMEVYASGAIAPGQATVKLATAGRICAVTNRGIPHPMLVNYRHLAPGLWYPGTATKSCAASYRWYRDVLCEGEMDRAEAAGSDAYGIMDDEAASVPPGSDGLFFHPYLQGEMTPYLDDSLRGSFIGLSSFHGKAHFTRAVLEGVAFSLYDCMGVLRKLGVEPKRAIAIGGGASSPLWLGILADVLGIELDKNENDDSSSLGSAMLAGVAMGVFDTLADSVKKCVCVKETVVPDKERHAIYLERFAIYKKIHDALAPVYAESAGPGTGAASRP